MNYLKLVMALVISGTSFAGEMPEYLKDGKITVTLKNGKTYEFSANEYKVVPRVQDEPAEAAPAQVAHHHKMHTEQHPGEHGKNRVTVHGGVGPQGLNVASDPSGTTISQRYRPVLGIQYQRKVSERISISGTYMSNETATLGVGLDF